MTNEPRPVADFVEATRGWQLLFVSTIVLWALGYFLYAIERGIIQIAARDTAIAVNFGLRFLLLVCFVGIIISARTVASGLGLSSPWRWAAGAWVRCCNPFVTMILTALVVKVYLDHGLSLSLLFGSRSRLEEQDI